MSLLPPMSGRRSTSPPSQIRKDLEGRRDVLLLPDLVGSGDVLLLTDLGGRRETLILPDLILFILFCVFIF